ncbi:MAG: adenylyltransferase/cytidyltransferase family protein [Patescibacteria group bacterium]
MKKQIHPERAKRIKRVMVFGTFDGLHPGHRNFFAQAAELGDVIAVIARDTNVKKLKGNLPTERERTRLAKVARDKNVRKALLGDREDFFKPVEKIQPDVIALGFDQKTFSITELKTNLKKRNLAPQIIRLKSFQPKKFKSSLLRKKISI